MPPAAPVTALPVSTSPTLLASGRKFDASEAGSREFSELFREQASSVQVCVSQTAAAPQASDKASGLPLPALNTQNSNISSPPQTEPTAPESADTAPENSSPKQSQTQSQNPLPARVIGNRAASPNSSAPVLLTESASPSPIQSKGLSSPPSTQASPAQRKKQEKPEDKQSGAINSNSLIPDVRPNLAPCNPPVLAPSASPPTAKLEPTSSIQQQLASMPGTNPQLSAAGAPVSADAKDSQGQPGGMATPPTVSNGEPASGSHDTAHSDPLNSNGAANKTVPSPPDGSASPKAASESLSSTLNNSLAPHTAHPAEQGTGSVPAPVSSLATSADTHPTETGTASSVLPHLQQPAPATATSPAASAAPNLYDKIDQGVTPLVLHSGPQNVAVGIRDPDLGWVEIKTQSMAGRVDATLVASSTQTHASLASQLPAMAQYLEQRDVRVGTLAVHHEMPGAGAGSGQSSGGGNGSGQTGPGNSGTGADTPGHRSPGSQGAADRYTGVSPGIQSSLAVPAFVDENIAPRSVSYISVRA